MSCLSRSQPGSRTKRSLKPFVFSVGTMAKPQYAKATISEISYAKHLLTASARPYPTKEGAMMKNKLDSHTADEYEALTFVC